MGFRTDDIQGTIDQVRKNLYLIEKHIREGEENLERLKVARNDCVTRIERLEEMRNG